jgi:hypothetical protein
LLHGRLLLVLLRFGLLDRLLRCLGLVEFPEHLLRLGKVAVAEFVLDDEDLAGLAIEFGWCYWCSKYRLYFDHDLPFQLSLLRSVLRQLLFYSGRDHVQAWLWAARESDDLIDRA